MDDRKNRDEERKRGDPPERSPSRLVQAWVLLRPGLQLVELAAEAGDHGALVWTTRALMVLGDTALLASRTWRR